MAVVTWFPEELAADVLYDPRSFPDVPQNVSPDSIWLVDGNVDKNLLGTGLSKFETAHVLETVVLEDAGLGAAGWALPVPSETAALLAPSAPAGSPAGSAPPQEDEAGGREAPWTEKDGVGEHRAKCRDNVPPGGSGTGGGGGYGNTAATDKKKRLLQASNSDPGDVFDKRSAERIATATKVFWLQVLLW